SPMTSTSSSRASSTWNASLIASTIESSAKDPPQLLEIRRKRRRRIDERMLEEQSWIGRRLSLGRGNSFAHQLRGPRFDLLRGAVVEHTEAAQVSLVAADALTLLLLLDAFEIDVRLRVVGSRVRRRAIRHSL